jgi:hypothetical protein
VSDTVRGVIVFAAALVTIALLVPLRNRPERLADGTVVSETYFGLFTYLTLRTELKEPEYRMSWHPDLGRMAVTGAVALGLWGAVIPVVRRGKKKGDLL